MNDFRNFGAVLTLALALSPTLLGNSRASAATFSIPNGDVAALKRALRVANFNGQDDTISLAPGGAYTLALVDDTLRGPSGLPSVRPDEGHTLSLLGNGATITRSGVAGTPGFRFFFVSPYATLSVSRLTLRNGLATGNDGGAIINAGVLALDSCVLSGNAASRGGALFHDGRFLNLRNCVLSGNRALSGGGISNFSRLNVSGCTFSGNMAAYNGGGGGISNAVRAFLSAQNSAFFYNRADSGGALYNYGSTALLFQCTLSGNSVSRRGGAVLNEGGATGNTPLNSSLTLRACTVTLNRAPYHAGLDSAYHLSRVLLSVRSSIVSGNLAGSLSSDLDSDDILQDGGFNLIGGNPRLAPLANNGGLTLTHALLPGSPAINAGDPAPGSAFDARGAGFGRVIGGRADIGAFELQQAPSTTPTPVATPTPTPTRA